MEQGSSTSTEFLPSGQENFQKSLYRQCLDKCGFCSSSCNLEACDCGCVAYCSKEHQKFDWKKHKPICKTVLQKIQDHVNSNRDRSPQQPSRPCSGIIATPPGNCEPATTSEPSPKSELSPPSSVTSTVPNVDCNFKRAYENARAAIAAPCASAAATANGSNGLAPGETLIETDDPDIQIIEGPPGASGTPQRSRKRTIQPKPLKDHTKNCAYTISPEEHRNFCREQGLPMNQHQSAELRLTYISEHILSRLTEYGWAVVDNFLGTDLCWHIHKEMRVLESRGLFRAGQVANDGKYKDEHHVKDIRSDKTYWFSGTDDSSSDACTVRMLITYLDSIVHRFSRRLQGNQIQGRSRAMLAIYPGNGSRYVKHVDNPAKDGRRITVIYYCNPDWNYTEDGGVLRLYPETSATPLDIEPRGDRLIAFWSDHRVPHEVMPVHRDRLAITVWYMDRNERDKHIKKTDTKPATSAAATQETASSSQLKGAKEKRMDTTEITTNDAKAKVDDATDHDDVDSGRGNSMSNNATSFRSRTLSTDSVNLSDNDDDDHLPQADDFDPEYNI